jgi:hypothetical protein
MEGTLVEQNMEPWTNQCWTILIWKAGSCKIQVIGPTWH